jgi:uncharacterized protein YecT (DUF1311 family)
MRRKIRAGLMAALTVAALCPARPALAQELVFDPAPTEACLAAAPADLASCIGHASDACMTENADGETTVGMGFCLAEEWEWWDARLNTAYGGLMDRHRATDADLKLIGSTVPSLAEALRDMQREWIGYRDAACGYERAQWGGGTGGGPAFVGCLMQLTGEQALALEGRLTMLEGQ